MLRTIYQDVLMMAAGRGGGGGSTSGGSRGGSKPGGSKPGGSKPGGSKPGGSKPGGSKPGGSKPGGSKPAPKPPAPKPPGKRGFLRSLLDFFENFAKKRNKTVQERAEKAIRDKQLQRVKELHDLFDKSNKKNNLTISGRRIEQSPESNRYGTTKVFNSQKLTDKQIRNYAQELAGGKKLKQVRDGIYTAKLDDGSSVTLRNISSSKVLTGARWTMDVSTNPGLKTIAPKFREVEIKFK